MKIEYRVKCPRCEKVSTILGPYFIKSAPDLSAVVYLLTTAKIETPSCPACNVEAEVAAFVDDYRAEQWQGGREFRLPGGDRRDQQESQSCCAVDDTDQSLAAFYGNFRETPLLDVNNAATRIRMRNLLTKHDFISRIIPGHLLYEFSLDKMISAAADLGISTTAVNQLKKEINFEISEDAVDIDISEEEVSQAISRINTSVNEFMVMEAKRQDPDNPECLNREVNLNKGS